MFTVFNSESLWICTILKRFNEIRDILDRQNIRYKYKVKDQLGEWTGSGTLRGRVGNIIPKIAWNLLANKGDRKRKQ